MKNWLNMDIKKSLNFKIFLSLNIFKSYRQNYYLKKIKFVFKLICYF